LLKCVVDHVHTRYNVGALVARSIALACQHNSSTALYYGVLDTMIGKYIESDCGFSMANAIGEALGTKWLDRETLVNLEILEKILECFVVL
jgi:hypothetical protein